MKRNKTKRLAAEAMWIVAGQLLVLFGSFAAIKIITENLDPTQYGILALALTLSSLSTQVITGGIGNAIQRYYPIAAEQGRVQEHLRKSFGLINVAVIATAILGAIVWSIAGVTAAYWQTIILLTVAHSIVLSFNSALAAVQNSRRNRALVALHRSVDTWARVAFVWLAFKIGGGSVEAVIVAALAASLVVTLSQAAIVRAQNALFQETAAPSGEWSRMLVAYAWPFAAWGMFTWTFQASDRWALELFLTSREVGLYAVAFQLGYSPVVMGVGLLTTLIAPVIFARAGDASTDGQRAAARRVGYSVAALTAVVVGTGVVCAIVLKEQIFAVLVGDSYQEAAMLLPWMVGAAGLFAVGQVVTLTVLGVAKSSQLLPMKVFTAIVGTVAIFGGAHFAGTTGVVVGHFVFGIIYLLWCLRLSTMSTEHNSTVGVRVE